MIKHALFSVVVSQQERLVVRTSTRGISSAVNVDIIIGKCVG